MPCIEKAYCGTDCNAEEIVEEILLQFFPSSRLCYYLENITWFVNAISANVDMKVFTSQNLGNESNHTLLAALSIHTLTKYLTRILFVGEVIRAPLLPVGPTITISETDHRERETTGSGTQSEVTVESSQAEQRKLFNPKVRTYVWNGYKTLIHMHVYIL